MQKSELVNRFLYDQAHSGLFSLKSLKHLIDLNVREHSETREA